MTNLTGEFGGIKRQQNKEKVASSCQTKNPSLLYELVKTRPKLDEELCLAYWIAKQKLETHDMLRDFLFDLLDDSVGRYMEQHSHLLPEPNDTSHTKEINKND